MLRKSRKQLFWVACFLFLWLAFSLSAGIYLDPDFGWHLKTGELVWQNGQVPQKDVFSYTMPDYPWRAHSWAMDALFFLGYSLVGYWGLAILLGFLVALAFIWPLSPTGIPFAAFPLLLAALASLEYMSVRPRAISFLFSSITFWVLRRSYRNIRWLWVLPIQFWFWANLHAGFSLGLALLLIAIAVNAFQLLKTNQKKLGKRLVWLLLILAISMAAILLNPYRASIYQLIFEEMVQGQKAHRHIIEWLPYSKLNWAMILYTSVFLAFGILIKGKLSLLEKVTTILFLVAGLISRRLMIYFFIFSLPLAVILTKETYFLISKTSGSVYLRRFKKPVLLVLAVLSIITLGFRLKGLNNLSERRFYPQLAVARLKAQPIQGRLFSDYNWGGYLIWKLPDKKVFVDGRMAIWTAEGFSAFEKQQDLLTGQSDFGPVFEQYQITHALLPQSKKSFKLLIQEALGSEEVRLSFKEKLLMAGWELVYQDQVALVLKAPETK